MLYKFHFDICLPFEIPEKLGKKYCGFTYCHFMASYQTSGKKDVTKVRDLSVPRSTDHPVMGVYSKKDFVSTNAATAIMGVPKKPQQVCVDRRQGDRFFLETSGLIPKYIKKKVCFIKLCQSSDYIDGPYNHNNKGYHPTISRWFGISSGSRKQEETLSQKFPTVIAGNL